MTLSSREREVPRKRKRYGDGFRGLIIFPLLLLLRSGCIPDARWTNDTLSCMHQQDARLTLVTSRSSGFPRSLLRSRPAHPLPVFGNPFSQRHNVSHHNISAQAVAPLFTRTVYLLLFFIPSDSLLSTAHPKDQNISNSTITRENASPNLALPPIQGFRLPRELIRQDRRSLREGLLHEQVHVRRVRQLGGYGGGA